MKRVLNKIMLILFVFFMFTNLVISASAEVNSKLQVSVTTEKEEYKIPDEVKYSIKLDNNYGSDLTDINVKANIPYGIGVISTEGKANSDNITWQVSSIKAGETVELEFILKVDDEQDNDVIVDVDEPENDEEQGDTEDEDKEINLGMNGGNNYSKPNNMPITGGINSILIIGIGILLVVGGILFGIKTKKGKKIISIFVVCTLSGGLVFGNTTMAKAETIDINIAKAKTIKILEKIYTVDIDITCKYEANDDEIIVRADRYLDTVSLRWVNNEGETYKIERGYTSDSLEIISEDIIDGIYIDKLDNNEDAYYRVSAYRGNIQVSQSAIIMIGKLIDTDGDGLNDEDELRYKTDINNIDTDGDGLTDYAEIYVFNTNPLEKDTDGDSLNDYDEIRCGTNPLVKDTDENGITDDLEDADNDGLTNYKEILFGSDPTNEDSDFDGLSDKKEKELGTDPNNLDTDNDGLLDGKEIELGTDPLNPDSNGNGILDGDEIFNIEKSPEGEEVDKNVTPTISIPLKATQVDTFEMKKIAEDDIFLSSDIPGYIGSGYDFTVDGTFNSASLTYEFNTELLNNEGFEPRIYYFNEEEQILEELENKVVEGNKVTATITHFSKYILLNKAEFDKVWETEIKPPSSAGDADVTTLDVALVIDSSGSMWSNDRDNLRIETSKLFVDKLQENDRAAVVDFDSYSYLLSGFTSDKDTLKAALDRIDDNGGTAIYNGIITALDEFDNNPRDAVKNMIVLTDGEDNYSYDYSAILQRAIDNNIIIYTIGLGSSVDISLLTNIATTTGGKYYHASSAGDLIDEFDKITGETIDFVTDTDSDGISDYYEKAINDGKLRLGTGKSLVGKLDPNNSDTDGDGLLDGEEIVITETTTKVYVKYKSDPTKKDSDDDGYSDYKERLNGTNPLSWNVSDRDLAMFSTLAYNSKSPSNLIGTSFESDRFQGLAKMKEVQSWKLDDYISYVTEEGGDEKWFSASTYKEANSKNIVVAFRGSSDWMDWVENILIYPWLFVRHPQAEEAESYIKKVVNKYSDYNVYITGHSLGGYLALTAAASIGSTNSNSVERVATFNGLGLDGLTSPKYIKEGINNIKSKITCYRIDNDVVSLIGDNYNQKTFDLTEEAKDKYSNSNFLTRGALRSHDMCSFYHYLEPLNRINY